MVRSSLAALVITAMLPLGQALAQPSKAVRYVAKQQMEEACGSRKAKVKKHAFREADVTGDGRADLIVNHMAIVCKARRNARCGPKNCTVEIYVRDKRGLLRRKFEVLAKEATIGKGKRPDITITSSIGTGKVRWNGRKFTQ